MQVQWPLLHNFADEFARKFVQFMDGRTSAQIVEGLMVDGIKSPSGHDNWYPSCIESMLQNEKFMGDLLLQKWYIKDFISKKAVRNNGKFPKYYVENAHEPIVPKAVFMQVKGEFLRREHKREMTGKKTLHRGSSPFYEKIVCSECGNTYRRFPRQPGNGYTSWRCKTRIQKGTPYAGRIVKETEVQDAVVQAFGLLPEHRKELEVLVSTVDSHETELQDCITALTEREGNIHDRISKYAETGVIATGMPRGKNAVEGTDGEKSPVELELEQMKAELDKISTQKDELLRQKAEYDSRKVYARDLLNLIDAMKNTAPVNIESTEQVTSSSDRGPC